VTCAVIRCAPEYFRREVSCSCLKAYCVTAGAKDCSWSVTGGLNDWVTQRMAVWLNDWFTEQIANWTDSLSHWPTGSLVNEWLGDNYLPTCWRLRDCVLEGRFETFLGPLKHVNCLSLHTHIAGRDIVLGIMPRYGLDDPGIESRWGRDFPHPYRSTLGPTQPPLQRESEFLSRE
jgi:hypothetical protein